MEKIPVMSKQELMDHLGDGQYVLEFMAEWCPDGNFIKPHLPEIEDDFPEYKFLQVDRDQNLELFKELNVMGIPSFIFFKDDQEAGRLVNKARKTKEEVEEFLRKLD